MKRIDVITDSSGSMMENGKSSAVKYLIYAIKNITKSKAGIEFNLLGWSEEIYNLNMNPYSPHGQLDTISLASYYESNKPDGVIFISDGNFSPTLRTALMGISKNIFVVSIGADSDDYNLKMISTNQEVIKSCDIEMVISECYGID